MTKKPYIPRPQHPIEEVVCREQASMFTKTIETLTAELNSLNMVVLTLRGENARLYKERGNFIGKLKRRFDDAYNLTIDDIAKECFK